MVVDVLVRRLVGVASTIFLNRINRIRLKTSTVTKVCCLTICVLKFKFDVKLRIVVTQEGKRYSCNGTKGVFFRNFFFLSKLTVLLYLLVRTDSPFVLKELVSSPRVCQTMVRCLS